MKEKIHSVYEHMTMPQACQERILDSLAGNLTHTKHRPILPRIAAVAACLVAVILLMYSPTVVEALERILSPGLQKEVTRQADEITITYRSRDGKFSTSTTVKGRIELAGQGRNDLTKLPAWYVEQDDRVYFAGNGEWIDVTGLISIDTPFTYVYTDQGGIIHYIAIGGEYSSDPALWNVGYAEWFYDPDFVDIHGNRGRWVGGYCDNYWNKETDDDWPWLAKAKEEMGIPWK